MRAARLSAFVLFAICVATASAFADSTPPVITPQASGTLGNNGWYVTDVTVSFTVSDPDSDVTSTSGCETTVLAVDTTGNTYTCTASSGGGTSSASVTVKRDATSPILDFAGLQATYSVEETIAIFCNAFDPISGVASSTCTPLTGLAYTFPLETPLTHSASAVDNAGNSSEQTVTFTVDVTYEGVAALVDLFVVKASSERSLTRKLDHADDAELAANLKAELRNVNQFIRTVNRLSGRSLDPDDAALLVYLAGYL